MSKKGMLPTPTGSGVLSKISGVLILGTVLVLIVTEPTETAAGVKVLASMLTTAAQSIANFIRQVV